MNYFDIIMLAIALSVDACVVSFSYGILNLKDSGKSKVLLGLFTGFFQFLMPIIGYFLTALVVTYIEPFAKYIVLTIFSYLGIKFILEAFEKKEKEQLCIDLKCLFLVGIATSIDAFSAGISLQLFGNKILKPAILIGLITFINSQIGFIIGSKLKNLPVKYIEILSGIILIGLGIKSFV